MNGFSATISGISSAIGRYFSIVSFVPSFFLVAFVFALIESRSWTSAQQLDWAKAGSALTNIGNLGLLALVSIGVGIIAHPLQFSLVQFFEGYWGKGTLAQRMRVMRIRHHYRKSHSLRFGAGSRAEAFLKGIDDAAEEVHRKKGVGKLFGSKSKRRELEKNSHLDPSTRIWHRSLADENSRLAGSYPDLNPAGDGPYDDVMPTRLGNVLRRYERRAGSQYGLDLVRVIQQLSFVAPAERLSYIADQRQLLDLSVRMSAMSAIATIAAVAFLCRQGLWLLVALVPWTIAYLSYRGAIIVAHEYGAALCAMIDLDRFTLYDSLKVPRPSNTAAERKTNERLIKLLDCKTDISIRYDYSVDSKADKSSNP